MNEPQSTITVSNSGTAPRVVFVEPWGEDYTLFRGQGFRVVAFGAETAPSFEIVENDNATSVYCENATGFTVLLDGKELKCGFQRQVHRA